MSDENKKDPEHEGADGEFTPAFDPLEDPFAPEIARVELEDGSTAVNVLQTVENYGEAQLPSISSAVMETGDVVVLEFDDQTEGQLEVIAVEQGAYTFGADEVSTPGIRARFTVGDDEPKDIVLHGSSISPNGNMMTPKTIGTEKFLAYGTSEGRWATAARIKSFDLKRPDEDGELQSVSLNALHASGEQESPQHEETRIAFETLRDIFAEYGFDFDEREDGGFHRRLASSRNGNLLIGARQGFGCGVREMYEIFAYNGGEQQMQAMRYVPEQDVMQLAFMPNVSEELLLKETFNGSSEHIAGITSMEPSALHRMGRENPFITMSWPTAETGDPVITVKVEGEKAGPAAKSTRGTDEYAKEDYPAVVVTLAPSESGYDASATNHVDMYWVKDREDWLARMDEVISMEEHDDSITLTIGELQVEVPTNLRDALHSFVNTAADALPEEPVDLHRAQMDLDQSQLARIV